MPDKITIRQIAEVCHEANRVLQKHRVGVYVPVALPWDEIDQHTRMSVIDGVISILSGEITSPEQSHENWLRFKEADGWTYGEVKDSLAKTHPFIVPFEAMTIGDQAKDQVFFAIVKALDPLLHD